MSFPIDVTIPAAGNDPADDQPKMQQNFQNISGFVSVDHIAPGAVNNGKHMQAQMFEVSGSSPPAGLITGFETIYAQVTTDTDNEGNLFFSRGNSGIGTQLTGPYTPVLTPTSGYSFMGGGVLVQWGSFQPALAGNINFPIEFPTEVFGVFLSPALSTTAAISASLTAFAITTRFSYRCSNATVNAKLYWIAIGN